MPSTKEGWVNIQTGFASRWRFPTGIGSLNSKHVLIQETPPGTVAEFFNCKNIFRTVLLGRVHYEFCFIYVKIGAKGKPPVFIEYLFNESTLDFLSEFSLKTKLSL